MPTRHHLIAALFALLPFALRAADPPERNGFKLTGLKIPLEEIRSGRPSRDGIPSIDEPKYIAPAKADFMKHDDLAKSRTATHAGVTVTYDPDSRLATARDPSDTGLPTTMAFWFAWQAFQPDTGVWKP